MVDFQLHDIVEMKKAHPCGCKNWEVLRIGMDIKFRCTNCMHEIMVSRRKAETMVKKFIYKGDSNEEK